MSVMIRGMKMPEKCGSCDLFHAEYPMHCTVVKGHKTVGAPYGMPRPDWCPLVELPKKHGDLIDRDALPFEYVQEVGLEGQMHCVVRSLPIKEAPAVIEAEGEGEG